MIDDIEVLSITTEISPPAKKKDIIPLLGGGDKVIGTINIKLAGDIVLDENMERLLQDTRVAISKSNSYKTNRKPKYSVERMLEAAIAYSVTGSATEARDLCDIPAKIFTSWINSKWWSQALRLARYQKDVHMVAKLAGLREMAVDALRERLMNGEIDTRNLLSAVRQLGTEKRDIENSMISPSTDETTRNKLEKMEKELVELGRAGKEKDITHLVKAKRVDK